MNEIVIYEDGNVELPISFDEENFWLSQADLVALYERDQSVISRHINKIFNDKEVDEKSNMQKMHIANSDKPVKFYSLDVVLAVGYKTNSSKAIKFRKWATKILKEYLINGYTHNEKRLQQKGLKAITTAERYGDSFGCEYVGGGIGMRLGYLKRFEQSRQIAFDSLLNLTLVLECLDDFGGGCEER